MINQCLPSQQTYRNMLLSGKSMYGTFCRACSLPFTSLKHERPIIIGKRDKIHYATRSNGEVVLTRAEAAEGDDPVLGQFLGFLARDIANHPERLQAVDPGLVQRLQSLVGGIEVDLDSTLSADDE